MVAGQGCGVGEDEHVGEVRARRFAGGEVGAGDLHECVGALLGRGTRIVGAVELFVGALQGPVEEVGAFGFEGDLSEPDPVDRFGVVDRSSVPLPVREALAVGAVAVEVGVEGVAPLACCFGHVFG